MATPAPVVIGEQAEKRLSSGEYDIVTFEHNDPEDPHNWSARKKRATMALSCTYVFCAVFGSAIYAPGEQEIRAKYGVNADVSSTGLTVYVLGFGLGPLFWGPLSELLGRRIPYHVSWAILIASTACCAFIEDIVAILIFRFVAGCASACALNSGSGVIADLYAGDLQALSLATTFFAFCALSGPCFATLFGFFIAAHTHGLWVLKVQFFFVVGLWPLIFVFPETYSPAILRRRARKLRKAGRPNAVAAHELERKSVTQLFKRHIVRPFAMMLYEPIVQGAAIWVSITYGILYFFFEMYSIVFIEQHGFPFQLLGLLFLLISAGMIISVTTFKPLVNFLERVRIPVIEKRGVTLAKEEIRLKAVLPACLLLPISLFWFAWTSGSETYWLAPALAGAPFGYANTVIFFAFTSYTSSTYTLYASSAAAANTFFRSVVASIFPIVAHSITESLGSKWGVTVFAFISLAIIPIPFVFIRFGSRLRATSRHAREARDIIAKMHKQQGQLEESKPAASLAGTPNAAESVHLSIEST